MLITVLGFTACQKAEFLTKPVDFTATTYETLGTYDSTGKPSYLLAKDQISTDLMAFIKFTLPERTDMRNANPELLNNKSIADITITKPSDVFITYVSNGAGNSNAIAFYTYPTSNPPKSAKDIKTITYVFPNAGYRTPLVAGDKVKIGRFNIGTSVGFVLLQDAWDPVTKKLNNEAVHFCTNDVLNPEVNPALKKHAVMIDYKTENKVLIGFEDVDRTSRDCDHDFNDVVIFATVN
jgi:hypothetical protein